MAYKLYLDDFAKVRNYEKYKNDSSYDSDKYKCNPLIFMIDNKAKNSFNIEEIDSLTSSFKNESSFVRKLKKYDLSYLTDREKIADGVSLVLNYKGLKQVPMIYHDLLIFKASVNLRNKKAKKNTGEKVLLDSFQELSDFARHLETIAENPAMNKFLLDPKQISYINKGEQNLLNEKSFKDVTRSSKTSRGYEKKVAKVGLITLLQEYMRYKNIYNEKQKNNESTFEIDNLLESVHRDIIYLFRKDYNLLRKTVIWENNYLDILYNHVYDDDISNSLRSSIASQIKYITKEKKYRNKELERGEDMEDLDLHIYYEMTDFINPVIKEYYELGGIEAVLDNVDADILYSNEEDAKKLGLIK